LYHFCTCDNVLTKQTKDKHENNNKHLLLSFNLISCGQLSEALGLNEELNEANKKVKDQKRENSCLLKHNIQGQYTDGDETVKIHPECKIELTTCEQTGSITNLTGNSLTLNLPISQYEDCLEGTHQCSYAKTGTSMTLTCGSNVFSYTKQ